jgi:Acetyltransferase (GNAT) family
VVASGELVDAAALPALVAGERQGLLTWRRLDQRTAELVTLDAVTQRRGIGSALLTALLERLRIEGLARLRVTTTNDNLDALRFYQRRGFRIAAVRPGAIEAARVRKPTIPAVGAYGIPLRDEIELRLELSGVPDGSQAAAPARSSRKLTRRRRSSSHRARRKQRKLSRSVRRLTSRSFGWSRSTSPRR